MAEEQKRRDTGENIRDGMRAIVGVVGALKDAIEETFQELLDQGELSPERAREAARSTVKRAQETVDEMRDRLDFVTRREFETLRDQVAALERQLAEHRATGGGAHTAEPGAEPAAAPPAPETEEPDRSRFTIDEA
jgi:polyhydroxyalkanoate synthesis regulator phasin